jgi:hypothetical protein
MTSDTSVLEANRSIPRRLAAKRQHKSEKTVVSGSMIFRQVYHDLFGSKDAQDASTLTYTWVADQFGHVTLGFIVTVLLSAVLSVEWSAIVVAVLITLKEAYDYICELDRRQNAFPFDYADVLFNCATSCIYTWIGAILSVVAERFHLWSLLAAPVLVIVSLPIAAYWLRRKVALQQSDVPFLYRLANFPKNFADLGNVAGKDGVSVPKNFADPDKYVRIIRSLVEEDDPQFRHVVLTGPLNSGKTSLAVGTATEFGYRVGKCRFISLVKLAQTRLSPGPGKMERPGRHAGTTFQDGRTIWPLEGVELLVVDDADVDVPQLKFDPQQIKSALNAQLGPDFFREMKERRTLWVAGMKDDDDRAKMWRKIIAELLTDNDETRVGRVALGQKLQSTIQPGPLTAAKARFGSRFRN